MSSPTPLEAVDGEIVEQSPMINFHQAIDAIMDDKRVARDEWDNKDFCFLLDGFLYIQRNGHNCIWQINDGDILGKDWRIVE